MGKPSARGKGGKKGGKGWGKSKGEVTVAPKFDTKKLEVKKAINIRCEVKKAINIFKLKKGLPDKLEQSERQHYSRGKDAASVPDQQSRRSWTRRGGDTPLKALRIEGAGTRGWETAGSEDGHRSDGLNRSSQKYMDSKMGKPLKNLLVLSGRRQPRIDGGSRRKDKDDSAETAEKEKMAARRAKYGPVSESPSEYTSFSKNIIGKGDSKRNSPRQGEHVKKAKLDPDTKLYIDIFRGKIFGLKGEEIRSTALRVLPEEEEVLLEVL
eukprot:GEMP01061114.1.p1 GENE.GEMP01061114.1~~GEMP01061114.1.p1  ORF type:complete len:280 (-),score=47.81 GEMP01061114.1:573-1373(-)